MVPPLDSTPGPLSTEQRESSAPTLDELLDAVCARIAPAWPLDRLAAVNPLWGHVDTPVEEVFARLASTSGATMLMSRGWYRQQWRDQRFTREHIRRALERAEASFAVEDIIASIELEAPTPARRMLVTDLADAERDLVHEMAWTEFVVDRISQACAAYFDDGQAQLRGPSDYGLYESWLEHARADRGPAILMGMSATREIVAALPEAPRELIEQALVRLGVAPGQREAYLEALLLDVVGWASYGAYRRWIARLSEGDDDAIEQILAVRLAWEWILHEAGGRNFAFRWERAMDTWPALESAAIEAQAQTWVLQHAVEIAYQDRIRDELGKGLEQARPTDVLVQAAFCIDVRSEVYRRALEAESARVQTLGFAGFFGLPAEYLPMGSEKARPQLPGLLAPALRVTDEGVTDDLRERRGLRMRFSGAWKSFKTNAVSGFSFVEATGLFYGPKLVSDALGRTRAVPAPERVGLTNSEHELRKPRLTAKAGGGALANEDRVELAAGILRAMSLTQGFARVVALIGHGSQTVNNPHAAGLDCGACCGHTGEANSRAVAALLNAPGVRAGLRVRGIDLPSTTVFVPGLHDTTTDEVTLYDIDEVPPSHREDLQRLRGWLEGAGRRCRRERAASLGLGDLEAPALERAVNRRARRWSEVRPEWGLTGNAAFIVAPREHCKHLNLEGRSFLHDYRWQEDEGFGILELIMTAPMVVTHWINFQYYASTVDNTRFGSGNKVLHNVVGGHLGVLEGNGGDMRIGLPMQSLHDGERWIHEPLRLSVFIEAPREAIERVLTQHAQVRDLVRKGWIHLFQIDAEAGAVMRYGKEGWER